MGAKYDRNKLVDTTNERGANSSRVCEVVEFKKKGPKDHTKDKVAIGELLKKISESIGSDPDSLKKAAMIIESLISGSKK
ncbi:MAG: hypothetical protein HOE90_01710 [Bacteriovoracaceae bacterium]|jgi:hypothetical protein|nr:hypothetical protein [Bacteriovoracaceae bacterium]